MEDRPGTPSPLAYGQTNSEPSSHYSTTTSTSGLIPTSDPNPSPLPGYDNPGFQKNDDIAILPPPPTPNSIAEMRRQSRFKVVLISENGQIIDENSPDGKHKYEIEIPLDFLQNNKNFIITPKKEKSGKKGDSFWSKYGGLIMTLFAGLNFTTASILAKILYEDYNFNSYSTTFWRYFGVTLPGIPLFLYYQYNQKNPGDPTPGSAVWPPNNKERLATIFGLFVRGTFGASAVVFRYYAIEYIPIGDMNIIAYSTPILVTFMAHFFLGEKMGFSSVFIAIISLVGVFIIVRPPMLTGEAGFDENALIGTALAAGSLICMASIIVMTRKLKSVHFSVMNLAFGLIGIAQGYLLTCITPSTHPFRYPTFGDMNEVLFVGALGAVSFIGQMAIIVACQLEEAGPVALLRSNDVIIGFILEFIVFGLVPSIYSAIGGSIVLACILAMGIRKWVSTLDELDRRRRYLGFLLR